MDARRLDNIKNNLFSKQKSGMHGPMCCRDADSQDFCDCRSASQPSMVEQKRVELIEKVESRENITSL